MKGSLNGGVECEVPLAKLLVYDGANFPGPGVFRELPSLIADLIGEAQTDRPFPFFRDADAWANVVAYPLPPIAGPGAGEYVKPGLEPIIKAVRDLDGLMKRMIGRGYPIDSRLGALDREVGVKLNHRGICFHSWGAVHLDFIIVLRTQAQCTAKQEEEKEEARMPDHRISIETYRPQNAKMLQIGSTK